MNSNALPGGGRSRWIAALGVSFLALVALALVPAILARQDAALERELATFSLARPLLGRIQFAHSQARLRIGDYVLSGDSSFSALYDDEVTRGRQLLDSLSEVVSRLPLTYEEELDQLEDEDEDWRVVQSLLLGGLTDPLVFRDNMADDRTRYEAVRVAEGALEDRLIRDEFSTESRLQRRRAWQLWVTSGIIALIVLGAVAMVFVIANYQNLAQGEIRRRLESVAVRRDLRSILRGTADGLIGVDQDGKCTFLNEAGSTLLGYAPSELRGQDVHSRIHHTRADGGEHSESDCPVHSALGSGETVRVPDDVLWRKDGTSFPVQLIVSPMKDARTVRGVVLTFTDMIVNMQGYIIGGG